MARRGAGEVPHPFIETDDARPAIIDDDRAERAGRNIDSLNRIVAKPKAVKNRRPDDIAMAHEYERAFRVIVFEPEHQIPDANSQRKKAFPTGWRGNRAEAVVAVPFRFVSEFGEGAA